MRRKEILTNSFIATMLFSIGLFTNGCSDNLEQIKDDKYETNGCVKRVTFATRSGIGLSETDLAQFPNKSTIASNPSVISQVETAWRETVTEATLGTRRERGFWVYYDIKNNNIFCGEIETGEPRSNDPSNPDNRSISLGRSRDGEGDSIYVCADFHTHTPLFAPPSTATQPVGPSYPDIANANQIKLPGLLCDYVRNVYKPDSANTVPHQIITFGPDRRGNLNRF